MPKQINADYQAFEFVTRANRKLELWGTLLSWNGEITPGVVEHQIFRRPGAIHQNVGSKPRKFVYRCTFVRDKVGARWRALADAIDEEPFGSLVDPRFGKVDAVCEGGIQYQESPEDSVDEVQFTIKFSETGLRKEPRPSAGSIAAGALGQVTRFAAGVPLPFSVYGAALKIAVTKLVSSVTAVATLNKNIETHRQLEEVTKRSSEARTAATAQGRYDLYAQASLIEGQCQLAAAEAGESAPPLITYTVEGDTSLSALCARLYGGRHARAMVQEILAINQISNPAHILSGTRLLIADPEVLRGRR